MTDNNNNDKIIKTLIREVIKKKLKNNYIKDNQILNIDSLKRKFNLDNSKLKLRNNKDVKDVFRYIENNNYIPRSVDVIYKKFVANEQSYLFNIEKLNINDEIKKCSGYEIVIDPLRSITIYCTLSKYDYIINNNEQIRNFINTSENIVEVHDTSLNELGEYEKSIRFNYDIEQTDEYKKQILKIVANILLEIFLLCNYSIVPLQVALNIYDSKDMKRAGQGYYPEILSFHRTFILFTRENKSYTGYYYDPEGNRGTGYLDTIYNIINNLNYTKESEGKVEKKLEIKTIHETCPRGIQTELKGDDIGLCGIYSHFWFDCFVEILSKINKINKLYKNKGKLEKIKYGDFTKYVEYINDCMIELPKKMYLQTLNNKYNVIFTEEKQMYKFSNDKNYKKFDNSMIVKLFINYGLYIIGYTYSILGNDDRKKLLEYIEVY